MRSVSFTSLGDNVKGAQLAGEARAAAAARVADGAAQASYALGLALESSDPDRGGRAPAAGRRTSRAGAGNRWIQAFALTEVLWLEARQGRPREALARYADVVDLWYRGGDWANQWLSLRHVFGILVQLARTPRRGDAARRARPRPAPRTRSRSRRPTPSTSPALVDDLRDGLGAATFASTVRRGASLTDAEIIDFVHEQIRALSS